MTTPKNFYLSKYLFACLVTAICFCSSPVLAQHVLVLKNNEKNIALSPHAYIYTGSSRLTNIDAVLHADSTSFTRNNRPQEIDYELDKPHAWCMFVVRNESDQQDWILKIQQSRVDTAQLVIVRKGKSPEKFPMTGHYQTFDQRPVHSLPFAYAIKIAKGETITFYLYTARQYGRHAAILDFQTKTHFEQYEYGFTVALAFVCGMVILASLVGFFLFLFVRQKLYVYYSIYAISFFFVLLADTGFAHAILFFPHDQTVTNGFTMVFYYWMGGCLGMFTVELLQLKQHARPWIYWAGKIMSYTFCSIALLLLIPGIPHAIRWLFVTYSYPTALIFNSYILFVISINVLKKEPIVYFYMVGFFFTSVVAILLTLSDFQLLNFPNQNKDLFYLTPLVEIMFVALGIGIHFSRTVKERIHAQQALNQTQHKIITIQEDERRRIAQDLHDDVGNSLAAVRSMVVQKRDQASIEKEIDNIVNTLRSISHDLMPVNFDDFSLLDVITNMVNKFKDHPNLLLEVDHTGKLVKLRSLTELVIYRIVNELVTNIFKHAHASKALVQLIYQETSLIVTVEDNGKGMKQAEIVEGVGMRSIRLRAEYIHAKLKIESDTKGTLIILEIPYEKNVNG